MSSEMLHVVFFKADPEKLTAEFPHPGGIEEELQQLAKVVPGMTEFSFRECNREPWPGYVDCTQGYTHCVVSRHVDAAALRVFAELPAHNAIQVRLGRCLLAPPLRMEMNARPKA